MITDEQLAAARAWIKDCDWTEREDLGVDDFEEFIDGLSPTVIVAGIDKHYDGGLGQFIRDQA